jgi:hypothetical protein
MGGIGDPARRETLGSAGRLIALARRAKVLNEPRDLTGGDYPDLAGVDSVVMMREHDPQTDDVAPRNVRMVRAILLGQGTCRLANDLQQALDC